MYDPDQELDEAVGDLPDPQSAQRREQHSPHGLGMRAQLARLLGSCALTVHRDNLGRDSAEEVVRQAEFPDVPEFVQLLDHTLQARASRIGLEPLQIGTRRTLAFGFPLCRADQCIQSLHGLRRKPPGYVGAEATLESVQRRPDQAIDAPRRGRPDAQASATLVHGHPEMLGPMVVRERVFHQPQGELLGIARRCLSEPEDRPNLSPLVLDGAATPVVTQVIRRLHADLPRDVSHDGAGNIRFRLRESPLLLVVPEEHRKRPEAGSGAFSILVANSRVCSAGV